jgi:hypothetical protein
MAKSFLAPALALLLLASQAAAETTPRFIGPIDSGMLAEPRSQEASGLAASRRTPDLLWVHDDSGGAPVLYAVTTTGERRGQLRLAGAENVDWEDMAAFTLDGRAWLCVADVGDNHAVRPAVTLYFVAEPDAAALTAEKELVVRPEFTLRLTYEDGPRDCESVAIDATERAVYLLSKREPVPQLYRLPLDFSADKTVVARRVGPVPHLPQPNDLQRMIRMPTGAFRGNPCAMDFAADGSGAIVLTYGDVLYFPRGREESWASALARPPQVLAPHGFSQAEAACLSADGRTIFVASEDTPRLLRYESR